MKPAAIVIAAVVALMPVAGAAEPQPGLADRVLDYLYPHRVKPAPPAPPAAPTPLPPPKPVEIAPLPEAPPVATPAPKEVMPDQSVRHGHDKTPPASADQERPARATPPVEVEPEPPKVEPKPKRARTFRKEERRRVPKPSRQQQKQEQQPATPKVTCTPITVDCAQVCKYAYLGEAGGEALGVAWGYCRPTPAQRTAGKACIRQYCPQWLTN